MIAILTVAARLAVIAIFSGVMFLVVSQSAASPAKFRAEARIEALNAQIREAHWQNAVLKERLEYRRSDGFILAAAKRDLMLIEPGDILLELDGPLPFDPSPSGPRAVEEPVVRQVPGLLEIGYIRAWRNALLGQPQTPPGRNIDQLQVKIKRIDPDLSLPRRESDGAAGFDLITRTRTIIEPGQIGLVPANVIVEIPRGYALIVAARSSTPMRTGLVIPHGIGIIDSDFHGDDDEIKVQVWNPTDAPVTVDRGDRIAQGILMKIEPVDWVTTDGSFGKTRGGFGTTGQS